MEGGPLTPVGCACFPSSLFCLLPFSPFVIVALLHLNRSSLSRCDHCLPDPLIHGCGRHITSSVNSSDNITVAVEVLNWESRKPVWRLRVRGRTRSKNPIMDKLPPGRHQKQDLSILVVHTGKTSSKERNTLYILSHCCGQLYFFYLWSRT